MGKRFDQLENLTKDALDKWDDTKTTLVRQEFYEEWMEDTRVRYNRECNNPSEIEWNDPEIRIQYELCDPRVRFALHNATDRARILSTWTPEMLEIYYARSALGNSYSDFEKKRGTRQSAKDAKLAMGLIKKKIAKKVKVKR